MLVPLNKFRFITIVAAAIFLVLLFHTLFIGSSSLSAPIPLKEIWNKHSERPASGGSTDQIEEILPELEPEVHSGTHQNGASPGITSGDGPGAAEHHNDQDADRFGEGSETAPTQPEKPAKAKGEDFITPEGLQASIENMAMEHYNLTSNMTSDGNYFPIDFGAVDTYNPNIIPHPYREDTYIVVAQRDKRKEDNTLWITEVVCEATFQNSTLRCVTPPMMTAIGATKSTECDGALDFFNYQIGPHDARVFYGPSAPYILYGSQSSYTCLGEYIQDLRRVVDWGSHSPEALDPPGQPFLLPTELKRPPPFGKIEKNWFAFWDMQGDMYVHYNLNRKRRAFAKITNYNDGSVGEDLAPLAARTDVPCMAKHLPYLHPTGVEWIHQSTNALSITFCNRTDSECESTPQNTYNMVIIQHKTYYAHGIYEPYILLFQSTPPFAIHAISAKPFWIPGRGKPNGTWASEETAQADPSHDRTWVPKHQTQMLFIVSMAWKTAGQTYHGYLDDELFISFGIEDSGSGGIVVKAGDLVAGLNYCEQDAT